MPPDPDCSPPLLFLRLPAAIGALAPAAAAAVACCHGFSAAAFRLLDFNPSRFQGGKSTTYHIAIPALSALLQVRSTCPLSPPHPLHSAACSSQAQQRPYSSPLRTPRGSCLQSRNWIGTRCRRAWILFFVNEHIRTSCTLSPLWAQPSLYRLRMPAGSWSSSSQGCCDIPHLPPMQRTSPAFATKCSSASKRHSGSHEWQGMIFWRTSLLMQPTLVRLPSRAFASASKSRSICSACSASTQRRLMMDIMCFAIRSSLHPLNPALHPHRSTRGAAARWAGSAAGGPGRRRRSGRRGAPLPTGPPANQTPVQSAPASALCRLSFESNGDKFAGPARGQHLRDEGGWVRWVPEQAALGALSGEVPRRALQRVEAVVPVPTIRAL